MKILIVKSLLTSLCQREGNYPSLAKRGKGRFFIRTYLKISFLLYAVIPESIRESGILLNTKKDSGQAGMTLYGLMITS
jgi:hypothetical protein